MSKAGLFSLSFLFVLWLAPSPGLQAQNAISSPSIAPPISSGVAPSALPAWLANPQANAPQVDATLQFLPPSQPATVCLCAPACWDQGDQVCCQDRCCRVTCGPPNQ